MTRSTTLLSLASASLLFLLTTACATPPKPVELRKFEAMRQGPNIQSTKAHAPSKTFLNQSDDFHKLATESHKDNELGKSKYYSLLGQMRLRSAENLAFAQQAREREKDAQARIAKAQRLQKDYDSARVLIQETITALEDRQKLKQEKAAAELAMASQRDKLTQKLSAEKFRSSVQKALDDARIKRTEAQNVKASTHAPGAFNQAANLLKSAEALFEKGKLDRTITTANEAAALFAKSIEEARPGFQKEQNMLRLEELKKVLFKDAQARFRDQVRVDGRGLVITAESLFGRRKATVDPQGYGSLDAILQLIKKYPDFRILVEGHTDGIGNAANNFSLSQRRAEEVKNYFLQRGISSARMQSSGAGGDKPFFKQRGRERFRNNRVDIVFLYQ